MFYLLGIAGFTCFVAWTAMTDNGVYITIGLIALVFSLCLQHTKEKEN